ncbi:MAG: hypothetical protein ACRC35_01570 [Angustibacter sp.]
MVHGRAVLNRPALGRGRLATMSVGWQGFLACRSLGASLVVLVVIGVLAVLLGDAGLPSLTRSALADPLGDATVPEVLTPVLAAAPLVTATMTGLAVDGAMAGAERLAARDLSGYRVAHLVVLLLAAGAALWPAVLLSARADAAMLTVENLLGATAVAVLAAAFGRSGAGWVAVFPYGLVGLVVAPALPSWAAALLLVDSTTRSRDVVVNTAALVLCSGVLVACRRPC